MKNKISLLSSLMLMLAFVSCGSEDNTIRVVTQGQIRETTVQQSVCAVQTDLASATAPLTCMLQFRTDGIFTDVFQFTIADATLAYQQRGQDIIIPGGLVSVDALTVNTQQAGLISGIMRLNQITNVIGGKVSGDFRIDSAYDSIEGHFSAHVVSGY